MKRLIIVLGLVAFLLLATALLGGCDSGYVDDSKTGRNANSAASDVKINTCEVEELMSTAEAKVTVKNSTDQPRSYMITIEAVKGGKRVTEMALAINDLRPGQTTEETAQGGMATSPITCKLVNVDRF